MLLKLRKERKGFTLIELMIVVAILGVLAAVAIPQYMKYVAASKARTSLSNFDAATRLVVAEFKKAATGTADGTDDVVRDLLQGDRRNPYYPNTSPAFLIGAAAQDGDIGISHTNLTNATTPPNATVIITGLYIDPVTNASKTIIPGSPLTLTKE